MPSRRILLTGAASGIGAATAKLFHAAGDDVISLDIKAGPPEASEHHHCDMSDPASIDTALAKVKGHIDVLLNVAGVPGTLPADPIMRVNTIGLKHLTEAIFPRISDHGAIVSIASIAGFNWARHLPEIQDLLAIDDFDAAVKWCQARGMDGNTAYHFSKECVVVYSKQLAGRGIARGIRANSISPGPVATPLLPDFKTQAGQGQLDWVIECIGRAAEPADIAQCHPFSRESRVRLHQR